MNLTYILLVFNVFSCLFIKKNIVSKILLVSCTLISFYQEIINIYGIFLIIGFYIITYLYFQGPKLNKNIKSFLLLILLGTATCFIHHFFPGFKNKLILSKVHVSPLSQPFSIDLNFDKVICAIIFIINSNLPSYRRPVNLFSVLLTLWMTLACAVTLISPGMLINYIKFDFKIPCVLGIWALNNLAFVSFSEEVIFREFLQNKLKVSLPQKTFPYLYLIVASIIFGISHFRSGPIHMVLASIAGIFYGFTYEKTKSIFCAMGIHSGVNLIHFIFFTYPSALSVVK